VKKTALILIAFTALTITNLSLAKDGFRSNLTGNKPYYKKISTLGDKYTLKNGKIQKKRKTLIPAFLFTLPNGTKNFEIPFPLNGPTGLRDVIEYI